MRNVRKKFTFGAVRSQQLGRKSLKLSGPLSDAEPLSALPHKGNAERPNHSKPRHPHCNTDENVAGRATDFYLPVFAT